MSEDLDSVHTDFRAALTGRRQIADGDLTITVQPRRLGEIEIAGALFAGDPANVAGWAELSGRLPPGRHALSVAEATFRLEGGEPGTRVACALLGDGRAVETWSVAASIDVSSGRAGFYAGNNAKAVLPALTFESGWGEGLYDIWRGEDRDGRSVALALDFRVLLKPVVSELALDDPQLARLGVRSAVVGAERVPSYLRDGPGREPERWLRLDVREADAARCREPRLVGRDSEGRERFVPAGEFGGIVYAPLDEPYVLSLRYVSALRAL